jgi:hypothetical protein
MAGDDLEPLIKIDKLVVKKQLSSYTIFATQNRSIIRQLHPDAGVRQMETID